MAEEISEIENVKEKIELLPENPAIEKIEGDKEIKRIQKRKIKRNAELKEQLLFEKYSIKDVVVKDQSLVNYITFTPRVYPNIFGRRQNQSYYNSHISIIERLINKLMRGGTGKKIGGRVIRTEGKLQGKKLKTTHVVEKAFAIIKNQTKKNPLQVFVEALENAAPIEDTTRVRYGGISYNVAVGISSKRRLDVALRNVAVASLIGAFQNRKNLAQTLASELILASTNSPDSYAIKKRLEIERIAKRAR